ncbi:MAG: regulatory protein RecX [Oceanospirillaceae bacterium]|nr:regulatory protein RecX [Oceanospirillaceae bacterium]MCP5349730.1 regulatory protein RecX [Oceanospirillaceae bacterium]
MFNRNNKINSAENLLDKKALRLAAMDLLARREHSLAELQRKLSHRAQSAEELQAVLQQLITDGLQSDLRFAGMYIRTKCQRGDGLAKIRMGLKEKGITDALLQAALAEEEVDWFAMAADVARRRFELPVADLRARDKALRYLVGKGYSFEQAKYALCAADDE